ncbi:MAG TPA: hypothetical protein VGE07_29360 [Herpetosiphonaceae bacterium]
MATHARSTFATSADSASRRERTGGPRRPRGIAPERQPAESMLITSRNGSHMPLDIDIHWSWTNPLNVIPGFMLLALVTALAGLLAG